MNEMIVVRAKNEHKCSKSLICFILSKKSIFPYKSGASIPGTNQKIILLCAYQLFYFFLDANDIRIIDFTIFNI